MIVSGPSAAGESGVGQTNPVSRAAKPADTPFATAEPTMHTLISQVAFQGFGRFDSAIADLASLECISNLETTTEDFAILSTIGALAPP